VSHWLVSIVSGSTISLFNRIRSQSGSTKYLCVSFAGDELICKSSSWDCFVIWHVNDDHLDTEFVSGLSATLQQQLMADDVHPNYVKLFPLRNNQEGLIWKRQLNDRERRQVSNEEMWTPKETSAIEHRDIRYGDTVILQHVATGLLSCPFVVRRVEEKCIAITESHTRGSADAVSQLHKLAFELKHQPGKFMSIMDEEQEKIGLVSGKNTSHYSPSTKRSKTFSREEDFGLTPDEEEDSDDYRHSKLKGRKRSLVTHQENVGEYAVWTIVGTGML
jgi:hypothetical protein